MTIADRIKKVRKDIRDTCGKYHIDFNGLKLLAVSKTHPVTAIQAAFEEGITEFAESYLQEALEKIQALKGHPISWHFIGPLQSNKTSVVATYFDWVQSIDKSKLLTRLNQQRPSQSAPLNVCIQLNYFGEPQKRGATQDNIRELLELAQQLPNIKLRGLMAIPPKIGNFAKQLDQYTKISAFYQTLTADFPSMDTLSIGMSNDYEAAISAGSNMVRIGTALFGPRPMSKH